MSIRNTIKGAVAATAALTIGIGLPHHESHETNNIMSAGKSESTALDHTVLRDTVIIDYLYEGPEPPAEQPNTTNTTIAHPELREEDFEPVIQAVPDQIDPISMDIEPAPSIPIPHFEMWVALARCESNSTWDINTGNGFYGGLQFHPKTWDGFGGEEFATDAHLATPYEQMVVAERTLDVQGVGAWPGCARKLGYL